jgi:hypothetical protein
MNRPACRKATSAAKSSDCSKFGELPLRRRLTPLTLLVVQLGPLVAAELDIKRRPASEVRGRKGWWRLICLINFLGPLSYFRWGRRSATR